MSVPSLLPQPVPTPPSAAAAALAQVRASLAALSQKFGQVLEAVVLSTGANGLTQLRLGAETLTLQLSQPLPPGMPVQLSVQPAADGTVQVTVQPQPATTAQVPAPVAPQPPVASMMPPPSPPGTPMAVAQNPPPPSGNTPVAQSRLTAPPTPAPVGPASGATVSVAPLAVALSALPAHAAPSAPGPGLAPPALPGAPMPTSAPPAATAHVVIGPAPAQGAAPAAPTTSAPAAPPAPAAMTPQQPASPTAPLLSPTPAAPPPAPAAALPPPPTLPTVTGPAVVAPAVAPGSPAATAPATATAPQAPAIITVPSSPGAPTPAASTSPTPTPPSAVIASPSTPAPPQNATTVSRPSLPLAAVLAQPAQAAAQQNSIAPLLQNLAVAQGRLAALPAPIADAAARLLAMRLPLDRGAPSAAALKQAVQRSGVFLEPPGRPSQSADVKSALLQLRAGLMSLLEGGEVSAIAPVGRRPPPPLRDAQPRGARAEPPTLSDTSGPRETARTLLQQTDAALSRLKLTQMAAQPGTEAARAASAAPDFMVELPMLLGAELALAQLQVQRDGKSKGRASERGWRVRFAVSFSAIGEVGAQVSLLGKSTNVVLWAAEAATADALEAMLPELTPALAARGLTVGSVRLRRGVPKDEAPASGQLMDEMR